VPKPLPRVALKDPFGPIGAVGVMQALAARHEEARNLVIDHEGAPTGIVQLNSVTCTACTRCVQTCPTGALGSANAAERATITFDASLCTSCEQCTQACPELSRRAISLRSTADMGALLDGRTTLLESDTILCDSCGKPIAPAPLMARITHMLGPGQNAVRAMITSRCVSCRSG
jgi:ferredoxin